MSKEKYPGVMEVTIRWNPNPGRRKGKTISCTSLLSQPFLECGNLSPEEMAVIAFRETFQRLQKNRKNGWDIVEQLDPNNLGIRSVVDQGSNVVDLLKPTHRTILQRIKSIFKRRKV